MLAVEHLRWPISVTYYGASNTPAIMYVPRWVDVRCTLDLVQILGFIELFLNLPYSIPHHTHRTHRGHGS